MGNNINIILAEDEYVVLMGLKTSLENLGYKVAGEATNGQEAVELALKCKPDLLIIDINMPVMGGLEAVKKINKEIFIPTIIITGYNKKELIQEANDVGVFNYLIKPVDEKELKPAIEVVMRRFNEYKQLKDELKEKEKALAARKFIEKAKGIIMDRNNIKEAVAMKLLQKKSRNENKKLITIAKEIIKADEILSMNENNY